MMGGTIFELSKGNNEEKLYDKIETTKVKGKSQGKHIDSELRHHCFLQLDSPR